LITKEQFLPKARELFEDTSVNITCQGRPYLGAPLGCDHFRDEFVRGKVAQWEDELSLLAHIAITQPHAAFVAFTHGMVHRFTYLCRTTPGIGSLLQPLEDIIQSKLIPAWTGRAAPNCTERKLFAAPARLGGLGISILPDRASDEFSASIQISAPLKDLIDSQQPDYTWEAMAAQVEAKREISSGKTRRIEAGWGHAEILL